MKFKVGDKVRIRMGKFNKRNIIRFWIIVSVDNIKQVYGIQNESGVLSMITNRILFEKNVEPHYDTHDILEEIIS